MLHLARLSISKPKPMLALWVVIAAGLIAVGLGTAFVATGSGLVMIAAAIPFATTHLLSVQQFGIGIAIAVLIDAFVVRPLLLPAVVTLLGRAVWWPTRGPGETVDRRGERPSARPEIAATGSAAR